MRMKRIGRFGNIIEAVAEKGAVHVVENRKRTIDDHVRNILILTEDLHTDRQQNNTGNIGDDS